MLDPTVGAHGNAVPVRRLRAVEDRRDLRHSSSRDDPRGADRPRAHTYLDAVGAGRDQLLGTLGRGHISSDDVDTMPRLHLFDHPHDGRGVAMRGVDHDHVDTRPYERRRALIRVAGDADRRADDHVRVLRPPHLLDLLCDGEIPMDDPKAAQAPERDRKARVGDRVHRGGEDRDVEADLIGEAGLGRDRGREDVAAGWDQEDVVEGQTFLGELVLPGQSAALTRASVSVRAN